MAWFRVWRFRRRYRRNVRLMARINRAQWSYDLEDALDKFTKNLSRVTLEDWQRYGLHDRRWH